MQRLLAADISSSFHKAHEYSGLALGGAFRAAMESADAAPQERCGDARAVCVLAARREVCCAVARTIGSHKHTI